MGMYDSGDFAGALSDIVWTVWMSLGHSMEVVEDGYLHHRAT